MNWAVLGGNPGHTGLHWERLWGHWEGTGLYWAALGRAMRALDCTGRGYGGTGLYWEGTGVYWEGTGVYWVGLWGQWEGTGLNWEGYGGTGRALGCGGRAAGHAGSLEDSLEDKESSACRGRHPIMPTIMAGKMEMVFPAMYIMNRFIGICFSGPSATSQQRCEETRRDGKKKRKKTRKKGQIIKIKSRTFSTRMRSLS